jgi:hypothetical protein
MTNTGQVKEVRRKRASKLSLDPERLRGADLLAVAQFCAVNPAFGEGGVRWTLFKRGDELERAGAIVRAGRRVLIRPAKYIAVLIGAATKAA